MKIKLNFWKTSKLEKQIVNKINKELKNLNLNDSYQFTFQSGDQGFIFSFKHKNKNNEKYHIDFTIKKDSISFNNVILPNMSNWTNCSLNIQKNLEYIKIFNITFKKTEELYTYLMTHYCTLPKVTHIPQFIPNTQNKNEQNIMPELFNELNEWLQNNMHSIYIQSHTTLNAGLFNFITEYENIQWKFSIDDGLLIKESNYSRDIQSCNFNPELINYYLESNKESTSILNMPKYLKSIDNAYTLQKN